MSTTPESNNEPPERTLQNQSEPAEAVREAENILSEEKFRLKSSPPPPDPFKIPTPQEAAAMRAANAIIRGESPPVIIDIHSGKYPSLVRIFNNLEGILSKLTYANTQPVWRAEIQSRRIQSSNGPTVYALSVGMEGGSLYYQADVLKPSGSYKSSRLTEASPGARTGRMIATFREKSFDPQEKPMYRETSTDPDKTIKSFANSYSKLNPSLWQKVVQKLPFGKKN